MTLSELAVTVVLLCALGLAARRFGISAIPAYLLAGLLLGPNEPKVLTLIQPSEVTDFLAELGIVFLLFFLGLEFSLSRISRTGRHVGLGGLVDLVVNFGLGLLVGVAAFGFTYSALVLAACVYVSSSAIAVKGLIDFRRLGDDETDLVLAILVFEDLVVAFMLGLAAAGGGGAPETLVLLAKALAFITAGLAASRWLAKPIDRFLDRLPLEFFLLAVFGFLIGLAAIADELGLSEAIGALMAGIVLSETTVRDQIEERFFSFRDIFAALFFFTFGLSVDLTALSDVGWLVAHRRRPDPRRQARHGACGRRGRRLQPPAELQRRRGARGARGVHDHPRAARLRQPARKHLGQGGPRRLRGPLRPRDRDDRDRPDEGVEASRPPVVPDP